MPTLFDDLPVLPRGTSNRRLKPHSRRSFLKRVGGAGVAVSFAYLTLTSKKPASAAADGHYFDDFTDAHGGPCGPTGYAANHTEEGRKCGPSSPCYDRYCCSEYYPEGNKRGWHLQYAQGGNPFTGYLHRPDECIGNKTGSNYDAWWWTWSNGVVYRCSDGHTCNMNGYTGCYPSICPYPA